MISDYAIEKVAVMMCEEMGLNPYDYVSAKRTDELTPKDRNGETHYPEDTLPIHWPEDAPPYEIRCSPREVESVIYVPRWRTFRADAAKAIAGWRAVHKYALMEG